MSNIKESKTISEAIKKCHANKERYIVRYNNSIFSYVSIGYNTNNKYLLYINILQSKCLVDNLNNYADNGETTTLSEAIGFGDEYKLLFTKLKLSTAYSKKEISNMLRHKITLSGKSKTLFTVYINPDKIVKNAS